MAAQNHRLAASRQRENQIFHLATPDRVEAGGRFVENDKIRIVDERLCQADRRCMPLENSPTARVRVWLRPTISSNCSARLFRSTFVELEQIAEEIQRLLRVEVAVEIRFLRQIADARLPRARCSGDGQKPSIAPWSGKAIREASSPWWTCPNRSGRAKPKTSPRRTSEIHVVHGMRLGSLISMAQSKEDTRGSRSGIGILFRFTSSRVL